MSGSGLPVLVVEVSCVKSFDGVGHGTFLHVGYSSFHSCCDGTAKELNVIGVNAALHLGEGEISLEHIFAEL